MTYYWKFLRPGAVGPFSGHRWATNADGHTGPQAWTTACPVRGCVTGVHACREQDLAYWLTEELWQIELAGDVIERADKVVAPRGRLLRQVSAWTPVVAREFALASLHRTVGHAVAELRAAGVADAADRLAALTGDPPDVIAEVARDVAAVATDAGRRQAAVLCGYVADTVDCLAGFPVASVAYIAARAANQRTDPPGADPYLDERAWQCRWLADRLSLAEFAAGS